MENYFAKRKRIAENMGLKLTVSRNIIVVGQLTLLETCLHGHTSKLERREKDEGKKICFYWNIIHSSTYQVNTFTEAIWHQN